jgi:hypothetical protein
MQEGTTSKVMTVHRPYGELYDFYSVSPKSLYTDYAVPAPLIPENDLFSNVCLLFFKTLSLRHSSIIPSCYQLISCNISFV